MEKNKKPRILIVDDARAFKIIIENDERTTPGNFDPRILEIFKDNHKLFMAHSLKEVRHE